MTTMNWYGERALRHIAEHCPARLATIEDQEGYFTALGEQIRAEVRELEETLAGPAPPGEGYLEQVGRMNMARLMAEERVLAELVWVGPEPKSDEPPTDEKGASIGGQPGWEPLMPDMSDLAAAEGAGT